MSVYKRILSVEFSGLFDKKTESTSISTSKKEEQFNKTWGDYLVYFNLGGENPANYLQIDKLNYKRVLNHLLFIKHKNDLQSYLSNKDKKN